MMAVIHYMMLPVVGFLVGLLIVSLGGGGGAIYVGVLTVFFHIPPAIAASTSLATTIPTTAVGSLSHWKAGNVNLRLGPIMLAGGAVGSIAGSLCSGFLPQYLYNKLTGVILVALAVQMLVSFLSKRRKKAAGAHQTEQRSTAQIVEAIGFGLLGGAMSGLVGLSGGGPIAAGLLILGCSALEAVGTSVLILFGIAVTGFTAHLGMGNIDWGLVGLLASGTIGGAFVGPLLLSRIDKEKLNKVLQPLIFLMTFSMGSILIFR